ncbi:hypothetical protein RUND412_008249 [Rhizina undulata]
MSSDITTPIHTLQNVSEPFVHVDPTTISQNFRFLLDITTQCPSGAHLQYAQYFQGLVQSANFGRFNVVLLGGALGSLFLLLQPVNSLFLGALSDHYA